MKLKAKLLLTAVFASAVLAGCGGGEDSISSAPAVAVAPPPAVVTPPPAVETPPPTTIANSVSSLIAFMQNLIATSTNDTGEPVDVNSLQLATDDAAEPSAI